MYVVYLVWTVLLHVQLLLRPCGPICEIVCAIELANLVHSMFSGFYLTERHAQPPGPAMKGNCNPLHTTKAGIVPTVSGIESIKGILHS